MSVENGIRFCAKVAIFMNITFMATFVFHQTQIGTKKECIGKAYIKQSKHSIYIGIMSTRRNIDTRVDAALNTWLKFDDKNNYKNFKFEVFARGSDLLNDTYSNYQIVEKNGLNIVQLPGVRDEDYPPQKKSFLMLKYMERVHLNNFDWFLRVDDDSYINLKKLQGFLNHVDSSKPFYIGRSGFGQNADDFLNFTQTYCMGGTGMIFSKELLRQIGPRLENCFRHSLTEHEDIEIGRCIRSFANVQCTQSYESRQLFYQAYQNDQQNLLNTARLHNSVFKRSITLHAIKKQVEVYRYHKEVLFQKIISILKKMQNIDIMSQSLSEKPSRQFNTIWNSKSNRLKMEMSATRGIQIRMMGNKTVSFHMKSQYHTKKHYFSELTINAALMDLYFYEKLTPMYSLERRYFVNSKLKKKITMREEWKFGKEIVFMDERNIEISQESQLIPIPKEPDNIIYFIVPLYENQTNFFRFIKNFEEQILKKNKNVKLIISLFPHASNSSNFKGKNISTIFATLTALKTQYRTNFYRLIALENVKNVSRDIGLQHAANSVLDKDAILFFCDVDFSFKAKLLDNIKKNTLKNKSVYYPIYFSKYNPVIVNHSAIGEAQYSNFNQIKGFWMYHSYELMSIYKCDLEKLDGFNTELLADQISKSGIAIFRNNDYSITHIYHGNSCERLLTNPTASCSFSKYSQYASQAQLYKKWIKKNAKYNKNVHSL